MNRNGHLAMVIPNCCRFFRLGFVSASRRFSIYLIFFVVASMTDDHL